MTLYRSRRARSRRINKLTDLIKAAEAAAAALPDMIAERRALIEEHYVQGPDGRLFLREHAPAKIIILHQPDAPA